jgi:hypothetical protein
MKGAKPNDRSKWSLSIISDLFVRPVEKIIHFGGPISIRNPFHDGCSTMAAPRWLFHDGCMLFSVASLDIEHFESESYSTDRF